MTSRGGATCEHAVGCGPEMIEDAEKTVIVALRRLPGFRGKANLALGWKRLRERRGPLSGEWEIELSDGSTLVAPRGAQMTWVVAATGYWDRHLIDLVGRYVRPETLVLDVGASLGLWSLPLGRLTGERQGRLWCFEPNPENIRWLTANIARNGLSEVTDVRSVAIGSLRGTAQLLHREHGGGNGVLVKREASDSNAVPMERIDDLELPGQVSFMKLDVEGFELEVLRGARRMIERDRPVIFGEFSSRWLSLRGEDLPTFLDSLTELGYQILSVEASRSAAWRPKDTATLRRLQPPFERGEENLLLVPDDGRAGASPSHATDSSLPSRSKLNLIERFPSREQRGGRSAAAAAWRIGASIVRRRWPPAAIATVDVGGARVRADLRTPLGAALYRYGFFSLESSLLRDLLRSGDVFVDGGANIGLFSLLAAATVGPGGRVLACEPGPDTMALLRANAAQNDLPMLELHQVALSDRSGSERFVVFEAGSGLASFAPEAQGGTVVDVAVTTLNDMTVGFGERVALVKLDVEGSEVKAIRGANELIDRAAPMFLVELEPRHLARQGCSVEELRATLDGRGYVAYAITPAGLTQLDGPWQPPDPACPNLLLAPPARSERVASLISQWAPETPRALVGDQRGGGA